MKESIRQAGKKYLKKFCFEWTDIAVILEFLIILLQWIFIFKCVLKGGI